jgi:small GTP-binding protein
VTQVSAGPTNVAMLLTPPGGAAIAVVRLNGPQVAEFLREHFSRPVKAERCVHGEIRVDGGVLDDAVVVASDDRLTADLNLHGGPWVVRSVLELARSQGFEVIERLTSPLPALAVDAKSELETAVLASLPLATTELALRTLLAQQEIWKGVGELAAEERAAIAEDEELWWLLHPPRVAIAGAANVGKSTLANQLFAQERSITADLPGTTRDWVGETANLDGLAVTLVDTPGIRQTTDAIEATAIERAGEQLRGADLVVLVLDASRPLEPGQASLLQRFPNALRVINKSDLPAMWSSVQGLRVSARSGAGVEEVRYAIRKHFHVGRRPGARKWWTKEQRTMLMNGSAISF